MVCDAALVLARGERNFESVHGEDLVFRSVRRVLQIVSIRTARKLH